MTRRIEHLTYVHVQDALSFLYAKSVAAIAEEANEPPGLVKKIVDDLTDAGSVERRGNKYRIDNAAPWKEK